MKIIKRISIPEFKELPQWFCWNYRYDEKGKKTKVPISYKKEKTGTDEAHRHTWTTFENAETAKTEYGFDGVGFAFDSGQGGIDIDKKDLDDPITRDILSMFSETYAEISPSGKGFHVPFLVDLSKIPKDYKEKYYQKNVKLGMECYIGGITKRYFTYTGDVINDKPITECTEKLLTFLDKYMLRETKSTSTTRTATEIKSTEYADSDITDDICNYIIETIKRSKQSEKFKKLFFDGDITDYGEDDSSADLALCDILAFYCGEDFELIDTLFCKSKLYRTKWDRPDYKSSTITKAIVSCEGKFYKNTINFKMLEKLKKLSPEKSYTYNNDIGMSELFADMFKTQLRYNVTEKQWFYFNGKVWKEDTEAMITLQKMKELSKVLIAYASTIPEETIRTSFVNCINKLGKLKPRETIIKDSRDKMCINKADFDKNLDLFNCQNGTLNLETLEFTQHNPDELLSKISNVVYNPEANCPKFEEFINQVMCGNKNKIKYLQKAFGYSLTADVSLENCFILWGKTSRNGKGTLIKTFLHLLGDYGKSAQPEILSVKKQGKDSSRPSGDIARLNDCRFLSISEPERQMYIDSALLKTLTGRDKITARHLHKSEFDFDPMFKLFINTNYLPIISDETVFDSDRINVITFDKHFEEAERDLHLKDKLQAEDEISGIFNWCLEGLKMFREEGLIAPEEVKTVTAKYKMDNDIIAKFFKQELVKSNKNIKFGEVYERFCIWCDKNDLPHLGKSEFKKKLQDRKVFKEKGTINGITWSNVVVGYDFKD